jgi:hypothetical protein
MRPFLAAVLLVGMFVGDYKLAYPVDFRKVKPENDSRLAKLTKTPSQKVGILTYYSNRGGGYTFIDGGSIAFYALPYLPTTYKHEAIFVSVMWWKRNVLESRTLRTIGTSNMPFSGQTIYRSEMKEVEDPGAHFPARSRLRPRTFVREDIPIATWSRDAPNGQFRLSIMCDDHETQLKLKSIVPVLERAEHAR